MLSNSDDFDYLRHQLLTTSTDTTYDTTTKRSTIYQTHDKNVQNQLPQLTENNEFTTRKRLIIHERHEKRRSNNQRYIHELWSRTFDDQQYCLEKDRQLWQSYLDIGLQQHLWPDQFYTMSKANDFDLCKQYVMNYTENNKKQLNHRQFELTKQEQQFQTCPMIELSFEQMEQRLQELVDRERKYLSKRNNDKLIKFKDDISEEKTIDNDIHVFFYEQSTSKSI
ncbi:unnamed protein product [Rotaria socialis]